MGHSARFKNVRRGFDLLKQIEESPDVSAKGLRADTARYILAGKAFERAGQYLRSAEAYENAIHFLSSPDKSKTSPEGYEGRILGAIRLKKKTAKLFERAGKPSKAKAVLKTISDEYTDIAESYSEARDFERDCHQAKVYALRAAEYSLLACECKRARTSRRKAVKAMMGKT